MAWLDPPVAAMASAILNGEKPAEVPIQFKAQFSPRFDYRMLARFNIDQSRLPVGSEVAFKPVSFWREYWPAVAGVALFVAFLVAVIAALMNANLQRQRAEIAGKIEHTQDVLRQLVIDLDNLDATIRLFRPDIDLEVIKPKPFPPRNQASKGEMTRLLLSALRQSRGPLKTSTRPARLSPISISRGSAMSPCTT